MHIICITAMLFTSTGIEAQAGQERDSAGIFTEQEKEMIRELPTLKVGYLTDSKPIAETDENGEYQGMTREIFDLVVKKMGISVEYIPIIRENQTEAYLSEMGIDLIANYEYKEENAGFPIENAVCSQPYLKLNQVFIVPTNAVITSESVLNVAVTERILFSTDSMRENYPKLKLVTCDTIEECFQKVEQGEADIILANRYRVEPYLMNPKNSGLQMIQARNIDSECCVAAVNGGEDDIRLIALIDKAIGQLSEDDINTIVFRETSDNIYRYSAKDFVYQYRYLLLVLAMLVCVIVVLVVRALQTKKRTLQVMVLQNQQLESAMDAANSANRAKSDFLARMSHEIRTPMNAIIGLTTVAKKTTNEPEKIADYLHKIETSSRILLGIINDVLDMSAIEKEKVKIVEEEFDVENLAHNIVELYQEQCRQKGIDFQMAIGELSNKLLLGDSLRINQILMNLLSNAVKFTERGEKIFFEVRQKAVTEKVETLRFIVSDTGRGVSKDLLDRLFVPFEQEDDTAAAKHQGSGLGLPITKRLVDLMGGEINVESEKGKGTKFVVDIPFKIPEQKVIEEQREDVTEGLEGHKVLVAEDIEVNMQVIVLLLEMVGIVVDCAEDGEQAVRTYQNAKAGEYDAILLDINMPKMDGYEAARAIRESGRADAKAVPIFSMTANAFAKDMQEACDAQMNGYIIKPIEAETLYKILQEQFQKKKDWVEERRGILLEAGIDEQKGIRQFAGNEQIYRKYLYEFPDYTYFAVLKDALSQQNAKEAFQAAHALKGIAGNLGMEQFHEKMAPLVEDLRGKADLSTASTRMEGVEKQYSRMVEVIQSVRNYSCS